MMSQRGSDCVWRVQSGDGGRLTPPAVGFVALQMKLLNLYIKRAQTSTSNSSSSSDISSY